MQPDVCTDELFTLLVRCWALSPEDRMSFTNIMAQVCSLGNILANNWDN